MKETLDKDKFYMVNKENHIMISIQKVFQLHNSNKLQRYKLNNIRI